jgi:hypothetical protein
MRNIEKDTPGMRLVFWTWMTLIAGGLTIMIALPLLGR